MAYVEVDGDIEGIPTSLYWRINDWHPKRITIQVLRRNEAGEAIDSDGVPIIMNEDGSLSEGSEFSYDFVRKITTRVSCGAYLSKEKSDYRHDNDIAPRKTQVFEFEEFEDSLSPVSADPDGVINQLYNNPLLIAVIPDGWVSDV